MENINTFISKFQNLEEVLSEVLFHALFNELIENANLLTDVSQIEVLKILADKFSKFYNMHELTEQEQRFISERLINWTNFSNLNRMCDLTGLMFSFIDKHYFEFLRGSLKTENLPLEVRMEVTESVEEFEKEYF